MQTGIYERPSCFKNSLVKWFWFRVSNEVTVKMLVGVQADEGLTGAGALFLVWFTHMPSKLVLVVGRRHLPCHTVLSLGLMSVLVMSSRLRLRANDPRESMTEATVSFITKLQKALPIISIVFFQLHRSALSDVGSTQGHKNWEGRGLGSHLGDWLPLLGTMNTSVWDVRFWT